MANFLDKKERTLDIILTQLGRQKFGQGKLKIKYFSFGDDEVDYQTPNRSLSSSV